MKYYGSDFESENLKLRQLPATKTECYNKIACLYELDMQRNPHHDAKFTIPGKLSKRMERLLKMYYALKIW